jgi:fluoroquinolone transport system permease protein
VSARRFANALRLVWSVQWKTGFPVIYAVLAVFSVIMLLATPLYDYRELLLPAIQLGEYGTVTLILVAAYRHLERNEKSEVALVVTPLRAGEYVAALALGSALVPTVVGIAVQAVALGPDWRLLYLPLPLLLTATFCGLLAIVLAARHEEFTGFLIGSLIPAMAVLSLPFLSYFGVLPRIAFAWLPTDGAIFGFANSVAAAPTVPMLALSVGALLFWNALALRSAARAFDAELGRSIG